MPDRPGHRPGPGQLLKQVGHHAEDGAVHEPVNIPFVRDFLDGQRRRSSEAVEQAATAMLDELGHLDSSAAAHPAARPGTRGYRVRARLAVAGNTRLRSG